MFTSCHCESVKYETSFKPYKNINQILKSLLISDVKLKPNMVIEFECSTHGIIKHTVEDPTTSNSSTEKVQHSK